jgi:AraC-like DNA-binding protein
MDGAVSYFIVFCCGLSLLMAASQIVLRRRDARHWLMAALFASLCLYMFRLWLFTARHGDINPAFTLFFVPGIYTIGPLLYLNYAIQFRRGQGTLEGTWRHFAAPALLLAFEIVMLMARTLDARTRVIRLIFAGGNEPMIWAVRAVFFSAGIYTIGYQLFIITDAVRLLRIRKTEAVERVFMAILCSSVLCTLIFMTGLVTQRHDFLKAGIAATGLLIITSFLLGQRYPEFLQDLRLNLRRRRYERTLLGGVDLELMHERLVELMEEEKIYADAEVTLALVARRLLVTPHQLSEFLNERMGVNFNAFVNMYRVDEARELLTADADLSILQIAYSVGFNSKSAFNAAFQRFAGTTPFEYRKAGLSGAAPRSTDQ